MTDITHDLSRPCWVSSAEGHTDFPVQNLPFGVFEANAGPRIGIAIGDSILDMAEVVSLRLLPQLDQAVLDVLQAPTLNGLMAQGAGPRLAIRAAVSAMLRDPDHRARSLADRILRPMNDCALSLPATIGDFTDFYAGIHHATNAARRRFPDKENPLAENYKYVPVGYHSRSSSVLPSGTSFKRPSGQLKSDGQPTPVFGPSKLMDFELELGVWLGKGNALGEPIPIAEAQDTLWGLCLLNDWSARDIQRWESQPLGPFLGKSFATVVSPWVITPEALEPFRTRQPARPATDPAPLPYLWDDRDQKSGAFDIKVEAYLTTQKMRDAGIADHLLTRANTTDLYWTVSQFITHHSSNGCNLRAGDLLGSGTISGPADGAYGSLNEITHTGTREIVLASGETRLFLEAGDEIILKAFCEREGYARIGFGECRGRLMN